MLQLQYGTQIHSESVGCSPRFPVSCFVAVISARLLLMSWLCLACWHPHTNTEVRIESCNVKLTQNNSKVTDYFDDWMALNITWTYFFFSKGCSLENSGIISRFLYASSFLIWSLFSICSNSVLHALLFKQNVHSACVLQNFLITNALFFFFFWR